MVDSPEVSFVVVNWNTADLLARCLASVAAHAGAVHEVIVVDNASADGSADLVRARFPSVRLLEPGENLGFGRANNLALAEARGRRLFLLNPDTELVPGAVGPVLALFEREPRAGIAGPALVNPDGSPQPSVGLFPAPGREFLRQTMLHRVLPGAERAQARRRDTRRVDWVTGAAMCVRRECWERTGGFDPDFFMFYEDTDWCRRARDDGWDVWFVAGPGVVHVKAAASGRHARTRTLVESLRGTVRYLRKHEGDGVVPRLRAIAACGAIARSARAGLLWFLGRDRADQRARLAAYRRMLAWAVRGGDLP